MKLDNKIPGFPFDFNAIPLWIEPNLLEFQCKIPWQRTKIVGLYALSVAIINAAPFSLMFLLGGLIKGFNENAAFALFVIWVISSGIFAPLFGFAALWDFTKAKKNTRRRREILEFHQSSDQILRRRIMNRAELDRLCPR